MLLPLACEAAVSDERRARDKGVNVLLISSSEDVLTMVTCRDENKSRASSEPGRMPELITMART